MTHCSYHCMDGEKECGLPQGEFHDIGAIHSKSSQQLSNKWNSLPVCSGKPTFWAGGVNGRIGIDQNEIPCATSPDTLWADSVYLRTLSLCWLWQHCPDHWFRVGDGGRREWSAQKSHWHHQTHVEGGSRIQHKPRLKKTILAIPMMLLY